MNKSPTTRFSDRVENYIKFRPHYPEELYQYLMKEFDLNSEMEIVEIGSGTGIFAEPLLKAGFKVTCVEPNDEMRSASEQLLSQFKNFKSIKATAEETTLPECFADVIIAAQAFHWFDIEKFREEFMRIRKNENVPVVLVWNERKVSGEFLNAYEELLNKYSEDYKNVDHRNINGETLNNFFGNNNWKMKTFKNQQDFDLEAFRGRVFSSSYVPLSGEEGYMEILVGTKNIFDRFNKNGNVRFEYDTKMYWGVIN